MIKHGMARTPTYQSWMRMKVRCENKNDEHYERYGARGIKVCDRWQDFSKFHEDMGDRPQGKTLDRIDVNGDYSPENCRWATAKQQGRNRRNNKLLTIDGVTKCQSEWCEQYKIRDSVFLKRIQRGMSAIEALTRPMQNYIEIDGVSKTIPEWARHNGIPESTVSVRISRGWSEIRAVTTPSKKYARKN